MTFAAALATLPSCAAAQLALPAGFTGEVVAGGLAEPVGMAFLPDGRLVVVEQRTARILLVRPGTPATVDSVGAVPGTNPRGNERGLLGIAVDPRWPSHPYLYTHSTHDGGVIHISRFTAAGALSDRAGLLSVDPRSRFDLLDDIPDRASNHNGGTVRFGPDGMLYVSLGEDAAPMAAQDTSSLRGVILRLDVSRLPPGAGTATRAQVTPPGNPFPAGGPNARLVWAFGLRNPFRFHVDAPTGRLLIADVGQSAWEEVDEVTSGGMNFGWPHFEGNLVHGPGVPLTGRATPPIYAIDRSAQGSASIVSAGIYRAPAGATHAFPSSYEGDAFVSDYYDGYLRRLHRQGSRWVVASPVPGQPSRENWATGLNSVADYAIGPDGALWYCRQFAGAYGRTGQIGRIAPVGLGRRGGGVR